MAKKEVKLKLDPGAHFDPSRELYAFLFNRQGKLESYSRVGNKGDISLPDVEPAAVSGGKLYISFYPAVAGKPGEATQDDMKKWQAYEPKIRKVKGRIIDIAAIPSSFWGKWIFCDCRINGHILKTIHLDGHDVDYPVYNAKVHVCEIDTMLKIIPKLPPKLIYKWRWEWLHDLARRKIIELKVPPFPPDPIGPVTIPFTEMEYSPKNEMENFMEAMSFRYAGTETGAPQSVKNLVRIGEENLKRINLSDSGSTDEKIPEGLLAGMMSDHIGTITNAIVANIKYWHPYFCKWYWIWPYIYVSTEIGTDLTDENGKFEVHYNRCSDEWRPDVYIWIEYCVGGSWVTVYRPCISAHTWWDYICNTDIVVHLTDPRVPAHGPGPILPGSGIEFRRVGTSAFVQHVMQTNTVINVDGKQFRAIGLSDWYYGKYISPFGSTLPLKVVFTDGLLAAGITHYRWKYKRLEASTNNYGHHAGSDNSMVPAPGGDQYINYPVGIDYIDYNTVTHHFTQKSFPLGPLAGYAIPTYQIPSHDVQTTVGVPPADTDRFWALEDFYCGFFDTLTNAPEGLYEVKMELLKCNPVTHACTVAHMDKSFFQVPKKTDPSTTEDAPAEYLNTDGSPAGKACGFRIKLRVDNQPVYVSLFNPQIKNRSNTTEASNNCGFLEYTNANTSILTLHFVARHPNDFGHEHLDVVRGLGNDVPALDASANCLADTPGTYLLEDGTIRKFWTKQVVSDVLGGCPAAAFAEYLDAHAWATNGTSRLYYLDRSTLAAFALQLAT